MDRVCLILGFVLIVALYADAQPLASASPEDCCFSFFLGKIPSQKILEVKPTGSQCPRQGFIVTTQKHSQLCVREVSTS